jgi:hypothetical protein
MSLREVGGSDALARGRRAMTPEDGLYGTPIDVFMALTPGDSN